jgi:RND family efflux transporter MFP subunit
MFLRLAKVPAAVDRYNMKDCPRPPLRTALPAIAALALLAACEESNQYVPPPPPQVAVANPVQQKVTGYLEATGSLASVNTVDLVARVSGFVESIDYKDGTAVKKGTPLFAIEREPYKIKLEQAKAAEMGARAALVQSEAEFKRQQDLQTRGVSTQANYDKALAQRDTDQANVEQAQANTATAALNYSYSLVEAPFDGVVTARQVSVGEYVGASGTPTKLATIVQLDPIWVNFNVSEQDVQRIRANLRARGLTLADLKQIPVEVGLQTETGYPHKGTLDYAAPNIDASTGTMAARGVIANSNFELLPGYFVRVRVPLETKDALLVPDVALGSDQAGRYVLVVNADNVVEQRKVEPGFLVGNLRVIEKGLKPDDRVVVDGVLRAIPGQRVDPKVQTAQAKPN